MNPQNQGSPIPLPFKIIGLIAGFVIACFASICVAAVLFPKPSQPTPSTTTAPTLPQATLQPSGTTGAPSQPVQPTTQPAQEVAAADEAGVIDASAPPPAVPELPSGFHAPGQRWRLGCCEYLVTGPVAQTRVGGEFARQSAEPGALFVILRYTETNASSETVHASDGNVRLLDSRGRRFDESSRVMTAIEMSEDMQMLPELQPNVPRRGVAGFEVPTDVVNGPIDFEFTERGVLGTDTATVRVMPTAHARDVLQRQH